MTTFQSSWLQWTSSFLAPSILCMYSEQIAVLWGIHVEPQIESACEVEQPYDNKGTTYGCDLTEKEGKQPSQVKKSTTTYYNSYYAIAYLLYKDSLYCNVHIAICLLIDRNISQVFSYQEDLQNVWIRGLLSALNSWATQREGRVYVHIIYKYIRYMYIHM